MRRGTPAAWAGWLVFDVLLWPLALLTGPGIAWAKLRGTCAGLFGKPVAAVDVEALLR